MEKWYAYPSPENLDTSTLHFLEGSLNVPLIGEQGEPLDRKEVSLAWGHHPPMMLEYDVHMSCPQRNTTVPISPGETGRAMVSHTKGFPSKTKLRPLVVTKPRGGFEAGTLAPRVPTAAAMQASQTNRTCFMMTAGTSTPEPKTVSFIPDPRSGQMICRSEEK